MKTIASLVLLLMLTSCSLFQSAPFNEYVNQEQVPSSAYSGFAVPIDMKDMLSKAFKEQVEWSNYDGRTATMALGAIEAELLWVNKSIGMDGHVKLFAAAESQKKLVFWFGELFRVLDRVSMEGEIDSHSSALYYYVRKDIMRTLAILTAALDKSTATINSKANAYTIGQFKEIAESMIPFVAGIL